MRFIILIINTINLSYFQIFSVIIFAKTYIQQYIKYLILDTVVQSESAIRLQQLRFLFKINSFYLSKCTELQLIDGRSSVTVLRQVEFTREETAVVRSGQSGVTLWQSAKRSARSRSHKPPIKPDPVFSASDHDLFFQL